MYSIFYSIKIEYRIEYRIEYISVSHPQNFLGGGLREIVECVPLKRTCSLWDLEKSTGWLIWFRKKSKVASEEGVVTCYHNAERITGQPLEPDEPEQFSAYKRCQWQPLEPDEPEQPTLFYESSTAREGQLDIRI